MTHDCRESHDPACPECVRHDETCGVRCDRCGERLCSWYGPEPAVTCSAHVECVDCEADNPCRDCATIRRATAAADHAWEAAATPGPYVDPRRDEWIDYRAEMRADNRAYELALLEDREEGRRAG